MTQSYIIVAVSENEDRKQGRLTNTGLVRRAIHDASSFHDIHVSDVALLGDKDIDHLGRSTKQWKASVEWVFGQMFAIPRERRRWLEMDRAARIEVRDKLDPNWREKKAKVEARGRAQRAQLVVQDYIETYGDDL